MNIEFVNFPTVRFKRPTEKTLSDFYELIYSRFHDYEQETQKWQNACYEVLMDHEELKKLEAQGGRVTLLFDFINIMIDSYTRTDATADIHFYRELLLRNEYFKDVVFEENPRRIVIKTKDKDYKIGMLTEMCPYFKRFPNIETSKRHGGCHAGSMAVARRSEDKCKVATGYVSSFGEGAKFLHSWVEIDDGGDDLLIIDVTKNAIMRKKTYYLFYNISGAVHKISSETIKADVDMIDALETANPYLIKLYLSNRSRAKQVYKIITEHPELAEKIKNDPLNQKYYDLISSKHKKPETEPAQE